MVLDEDALEAMLRRQGERGNKKQEVELTHETEEFAVYERPADEKEEPAEPEPEPTPEPAPEIPAFEDITAPVVEEQPEPMHIPVPQPIIHGQIPEPTPEPEPTVEPEPEPIPVTPRTHAPEPTTHNFAPPPAASAPGEGPRVAIIQALFNQELTDMMAELAKAKAKKLGAEVSHHVTVPGVYDLPLITRDLLMRDDVDCAVVLGVVVQGETSHDELITNATAQTLQHVTLETGKPVGFGVSGPGMTWAQAEARVANGAHAVEAAVSQVRALA